MNLNDKSEKPRASAGRTWAIVIGGVIGFGIAFFLYIWLNPILEARRDWIRELQGVLFTLIPVGSVAGAMLGWGLSRRQSKTIRGN